MTVLVILIIVAVAVFVAMKTGKVKDANNNNIPDAIEKPIEEIKEVIAKVKATKAPVANPAAKKPVAKTTAKKAK
jgi:uncharacterized membrane protein